MSDMSTGLGDRGSGVAIARSELAAIAERHRGSDYAKYLHAAT